MPECLKIKMFSVQGSAVDIYTYVCVLRPRRASFGSREAMRGDSVTHQLTKKLQHLKKKIKQFEEQFEKERNYKVQTKKVNQLMLQTQ